MSVAQQLGLDDVRNDLMTQASDRWDAWAKTHPPLAQIGGLENLRDWLRAATASDADDVLYALVTLAAPDGDDDLAAATTVAWALLPGACSLANGLRTLSPEIDQLVAAQLWLEIRSFPWRRLRKVAANILMNTRATVLRECGATSQLARTDPVWTRTNVVDPSSVFWDRHLSDDEEPHPSAEQELLEVLDWACAHGVIDDADRALLLCLVSESDYAPTARVRRGYGGLMANDVSQRVGDQWGISASTVRRRARRCVRALSAACGPQGLAA